MTEKVLCRTSCVCEVFHCVTCRAVVSAGLHVGRAAKLIFAVSPGVTSTDPA